jgi:hypothetical protein
VSFTYSVPWSGSRDYMRFQIQDTLAPSQFQDEELDSLLLQWGGDARMASAAALEAWAALLGRSAISYSVTGFSMNRTSIVDNMMKAAERLRGEAMSEPFEFESIVDHHMTIYGEDWSNYITTPGTGGWFY